MILNIKMKTTIRQHNVNKNHKTSKKYWGHYISRYFFDVIMQAMILISIGAGMSMASPQYSDTNGDHYQNRDIIPRRTSSSRHQPTPKILSSDQVFRAEEGETLVLPCKVANMGSFVLMWKKDDRVLTAGNLVVRKDSRLQLRNDFSLEINSLKPEDQGPYICEIDVMGQAITIDHTVEVMVPPAIQPMPRQGIIRTRKGKNITLRCAGKGNPNPRISWSKQGGLLNTGYTKVEGLSLQLENVGRTDAGIYICTANNGVGESASAQITVNINYPPEIEIEQNWYERDGVVEVEIICVVHANPEAEVHWTKGQKKLHETDRKIFTKKAGRNTLHIRNVQPIDFGNYSCRADNELGKARTYTSLSGQPRPPRFVSDSIGYRPHAYNVTWTTDSFTPITEYKLLYRRSDGLPISQNDVIDESSGNWESVFIPISDLQIENKFSTRTTYTLKNLQSGAVYDIVAKAKNNYGWSEQSKTFNFFNKGVDYSTQLLSAPNDGPGGGGGTGIYLDHNQYSSKSSSRGGNIIGKDFGTNAVKHVPPGKKLDFSSPSLYTNSSGRMGSDGFLHIILAVAISAVTSILFSYSQLFSSTYKSPWSCYKTSKDKKFMQKRINVDTRSMKHEPDNNHNVEHNIQYLKRYVACNRNSDGGDSRRNSSKLNKKKESMACVLCI